MAEIRVSSQMSSEINVYLDSLLLRSFLPTVEENVVQRFYDCVNGRAILHYETDDAIRRAHAPLLPKGTDAFQVEAMPLAYNPTFRPLLKVGFIGNSCKYYRSHKRQQSAVALMALIQDICLAFYTIPIHQAEIIKMIEMIQLKYYEKCLGRYRGKKKRGRIQALLT
jgi:hypothetical protein